MKLRFAVLLFIVFIITTRIPENHSYEIKVNGVNLMRHLIQAFSFVRHHNQPELKDISRKYIDSYMRRVLPNAHHIIQEFNGTILGEEVPAINFVSVIPGTRWGTKEDKITVLLTHYDTQPTTPGVNDNGSGCASNLELARILGEFWAKYDHTCLRLNSLIITFVDIEENGIEGSRYFVDKWLVPSILERFNIGPDVLQGVIVTDNVLNYEEREGASYPFPAAIDKEVPSYNEINGQNSFKGDFVASFVRTDDMKFNNFVQDIWRDVHGDGFNQKLKFFTFPLPITGNINKLSSEMKKLFFDIFRSDHRNFWNHTSSSYPDGVPTLFLSDTVYFRGFMRQCYHKECDDLDHVTEPSVDFLKVFTNIMTRVAIAAQSEDKSLRCLTSKITI